ncbi:MAG: alanine racemase [Clostridia bacterium]|nr:alanine racemase [Clostridia bacterium]
MDKIVKNYQKILAKVGDKKVYCVVKSNAYGCGASVVARELENNGASGFVVSNVLEGAKLRKNGIKKPILVLGLTEIKDFWVLKRYDLTQSVFCFEYLDKILDFTKKTSGALKVWLKFNCGFNRLGFDVVDAKKLFDLLYQNINKISVTGAFAHLSSGFTPQSRLKRVLKYELDRFCELKKQAQTHPFFNKNTTILWSILNSVGVNHFTNAFDVMRVGASLYGLGEWGYDGEWEFFAKLLQVNKLTKGQSVGYDDTFVAKKDCFVGVLDVGYADGLPRRASQYGLKVFVDGDYCPIIGSVCMNHSFILLPRFVKSFCQVEVVGRHLSPSSVAKKLNTIDYEILCGFGKNSPFIYKKTPKIKED